MTQIEETQAARSSPRLTGSSALAIGLIVLLGIGLRTSACLYAHGIVHPDEHQQYLEQANRLAFGYSATFWEQERGMRNYLFPAILALLLLGLDSSGFTDPVLQAAALRWILSLAALAAMVAIVIRVYKRGHTTAAASS